MLERVKQVFFTPNALSILRLVLAPINAACLINELYLVSAALFCTAVISDLLDGYWARKKQLTTTVGRYLDHLADCAFVVCAFLALSVMNFVTVVLPILVMLAFTQYVFDSKANGKATLSSSRLGRWNGITYFVFVGVTTGKLVFGLTWLSFSSLQIVAWILCATTIASMIERTLNLLSSRAARK